MKKKIYIFSEIVTFAHQISNKEIVETKEVLMRQEEDGISVAHRLACFHSTWTTDIPEILSLYSACWKETVEDLLVKRDKMFQHS